MSTYLLAIVVGKFDFVEGCTKKGVKVSTIHQLWFFSYSIEAQNYFIKKFTLVTHNFFLLKLSNFYYFFPLGESLHTLVQKKTRPDGPRNRRQMFEYFFRTFWWTLPFAQIGYGTEHHFWRWCHGELGTCYIQVSI